MVLLIGGHPRSGTTLLWSMCNGHPSITMTLELANFRGLGEPYPAYRYLMLERLGFNDIFRNRFPFEPVKNNRWRDGLIILLNHAFLARYLFKMQRYRQRRIDGTAVEATLRSILTKTIIVGDKYSN